MYDKTHYNKKKKRKEKKKDMNVGTEVPQAMQI